MADAGTANGLQASEELGNLPIRNWKQGSWAEGAKKNHRLHSDGNPFDRDIQLRNLHDKVRPESKSCRRGPRW